MTVSAVELKLHDLHIFMMVAETGSMGKAAEFLSISQPSVSKAISEIEHTVGVRLLDRTPKGVEITPYGRALLRRGIGAFHELRQSIKDIELLSDPMAGTFRSDVLRQSRADCFWQSQTASLVAIRASSYPCMRRTICSFNFGCCATETWTS